MELEKQLIKALIGLRSPLGMSKMSTSLRKSLKMKGINSMMPI